MKGLSMQLTPLCTPEVSVKPDGSQGAITPVRCKRWSCEVCREVNRRKVIHKALSGHPTAMLTLTVSSKNYETPDEAAFDLKRGLVALRKRIRRKWPNERLPFLAVFEQHKSGWPHMHLVIRASFISIWWLRKAWEEITGSWNVNITSLRGSTKRAAYVCKYIGKDLHSFHKCKRWWRSHDYNEPEEETEEDKEARRGWGREMWNIGQVLVHLDDLGAIIDREGRERYYWRSPPDRPITWSDVKTSLTHRFLGQSLEAIDNVSPDCGR